LRDQLKIKHIILPENSKFLRAGFWPKLHSPWPKTPLWNTAAAGSKPAHKKGKHAAAGFHFFIFIFCLQAARLFVMKTSAFVLLGSVLLLAAHGGAAQLALRSSVEKEIKKSKDYTRDESLMRVS
jgi:hypothetical protein